MTRPPCLEGLISVVLALTAVSHAHAEATVTIRYATNAVPSLWRVQVEGNRVTATDAQGAMQWSASPSNGVAPDCAGVTQLTPVLEDANGDGLIDAERGEQARLVVSSSWRDGGGWQSAVLALDVSRPGESRQLWRRDGDALTRLARLVAAPTVVRLRVGRSNRDPQHFVVLLGGGLPTPATSTHGARDGAALLMLDAEDGALLWAAAAAGSVDQRIATLNAGVSGAVTALDLDRDGFADRLYVGDARASLWRFDVVPGTAPGLRLAGGRLAQLAAAYAPDSRSIIAAPDIALQASPGVAPWFNVAVGTVRTSGASGPSATQGLFVLRDRHPFEALTQGVYDRLSPVTANQLPGAATTSGDTATVIPVSAPGYRIDLPGDGLVARPITAGGVLLYSQVTAGDPLNACAAATPLVIVSVGAVSALDGRVALDLDANGRVDPGDRSVELAAGSAGAFDGPRLESDAATDGGLRCRIGTASLATCPHIARLSRRYWRREDAD
jgi:Tfp pilus tip-associated adhesin PilY1